MLGLFVLRGSVLVPIHFDENKAGWILPFLNDVKPCNSRFLATMGSVFDRGCFKASIESTLTWT